MTTTDTTTIHIAPLLELRREGEQMTERLRGGNPPAFEEWADLDQRVSDTVRVFVAAAMSHIPPGERDYPLTDDSVTHIGLAICAVQPPADVKERLYNVAD